MPTPILIISDAPTSGTGLGRITKDLATRIALHLPEFRVATLGYGGPYSRALPFHQYQLEMDNWQILNLPEVWQDFVGEERGIAMTIWDASRLLWFARSENCTHPVLRKFLEDAPMEKWGYFPMDATGPNDRLTAVLKHTIEGYDRALAYSKWAEDILRRTLWKKPLLEGMTNLPHGIDTSVFYPRDKAKAKAGFGERIGMKSNKNTWLAIPDNMFTIGIVATNQARKDYGLGIQTIAELSKERPVFFWIHTDVLERHWSLPALLNDYGLKSYAITNVPLTDDQMAWCMSACDVTLGIGNGEGYGLPIFESLACGVPCVHGDYGGAPEHMPKRMLVKPAGEVRKLMRLDGPYNSFRPMYDFGDWVDCVNYLADNPEPVCLPSHLDWNNLWPRWAEWFRKGP